jgi:hypothetical protein
MLNVELRIENVGKLNFCNQNHKRVAMVYPLTGFCLLGEWGFVGVKLFMDDESGCWFFYEYDRKTAEACA